MTGIVQRLREFARNPENETVWGLDDAADEIERLRAALRRIASRNVTLGNEPWDEAMIREARRALRPAVNEPARSRSVNKGEE